MKGNKNINIWAFAKFQAILMFFLGVVAGMLYSVGGLFIDLLTIGLNQGTALAFLALLGMPMIFAVAGFVAGIVEAIIFNVLVSRFVDIEINFEKT